MTALTTDAPRLGQSEFGQVRRLAYEWFGLDLKPGKEALVAARLGKRLREEGLSSYTEYLEMIQRDPSGQRRVELIDALTTNFTSFWRESAHFEFLRQRLASGRPPGRPPAVWSAACSTGEEPYTIILCLLAAGFEPARVQVRASDISTRALAQARSGVYPEARVEPLPQDWRRRYFVRGVGASAGFVKVRPEVQQCLQLERRNLLEPFGGVGSFDAIFCRNVMIYFDRPTQSSLVGRLAERLLPGGYLFLGHSEGLLGMDHGLKAVAPATYRKPGGPREH
jgi:chemotaxis protein methyltransferase CheR